MEITGYWDTDTTWMLQGVLGAIMDDGGRIVSQPESNRPLLEGCTTGWEFVPDDEAKGSYVIAMMQNRLGVDDDGIVGPATIKALEEWYGIYGDGKLGPRCPTIMEMQESLEAGEF